MIVKKILLSVCSVVFTLFLAELCIRSVIFIKSRRSFDAVISHPSELDVYQPNHALGQLVLPSRFPGIIYELRHNLNTTFMNVPVVTNDAGWRGKLYPVGKAGNTVRIVALGDSHLFGWGVKEEERYTNVLERELNAGFPGRKWEIVNTGVPGYNAFMEVETLKWKGLAYAPDIVLIEYIGNDLDLPNFIMDTTAYLDFRKSFLLSLIRRKTDVLKTRMGLMDTQTVQSELGIKFPGEEHNELVPERYKHMVGWRSYVNSMSKLKRMQEEHGFEVVVCVSQFWPDGVQDKIVSLCRKNNFHVLLSQQKLDPELILSKEDAHPSALGHLREAEVLLDFLEKEGLIKRFAGGK